MKPLIAVIDYGMGNLRSVGKALEKAGGRVQVTDSVRVVRSAQGVVLPGVGAFGDASRRLSQTGLAAAAALALEGNKPFLGICLGLQLLFERSEETPGVPGLGFWKGVVRRFPRTGKLKVPHMGWNTLLPPSPAVKRETIGPMRRWTDGTASTEAKVASGVGVRAKAVVPSSQPSPVLRREKEQKRKQKILEGLKPDDYFYFVHSYYPAPEDKRVIATLTAYGTPFCSSAEQGRVFACQFHPEKSAGPGQQLLKNYVRQVALCS